jgi:hypothetical protein
MSNAATDYKNFINEFLSRKEHTHNG